jgi:hypothetical protein
MPNEVTITIKGKDEASSTLDNVEKKAGGLGSALSGVTKIAGGFVLAEGIMKAPDFLMSAAQAAADDAASVAQLQKAVENTGVSWDAYRGQLEGVVESGMKKGFTDDEQRQSLALLMAQTGDATEAQKRFAIAQDLARGANIDLTTASKLTGKVTEENANVFKRMGISLEKGASEAEVFAALQQKFGGQADTYAQSTAGQMAAAKIQMSELKESIGYLVLPIMTKLVGVVVNDLIPAIQKLVAEWGPKLKEAFDEAHRAIQPLIDALEGPLKSALKYIMDHKEMLVGALAAIGAIILVSVVPPMLAWAAATIVALAPFIAIIAAGALLALGIKELIDHWDQIKATMQRFWEFAEPFAKAMAVILLAPFLPLIAIIVLVIKNWGELKEAAVAIFGAIQATIDEKLGFITDIVTLAFEVIKTLFVTNLQIIWATVSFVFEVIKGVIETAMKVLSDMFDVGLAILKGDWGGAWDAIKQMFGDFWWGIWGVLDSALAYLGTLGTLILNAVGDLAGLLYNFGSDAIQGFWDGMKDMAGNVLDWAGDFAGDIGGKLNPANWFGSPKGLQNWLPYYFEEGMKNLRASVAATGNLGISDAVRPLAIAPASRAIAAAQKTGRGDVIVNVQTINAGSEDEAKQAASSVGYGIQQAMRARGVAA